MWRILSLILYMVFLLEISVTASDSILPQGESRPALINRYFPSRIHEFVWRNWSLVEPGKLAKILGASVQDVNMIAESMGLPPDVTVQPGMLERGYAALIRRNWHLLPYTQLLELLDMAPERLDVILREEDFLWIKLGSLKPQCEPLHYTPPDEAALKRAVEIRHVIEQEFGDALRQPSEPRFDFVRQLSEPLSSFSPPEPGISQKLPIRLVYSYAAVYGDPLLNPKLNPYPDGLLERLASVGVNGVWLQGLLRDLAPGGNTFPEFGVDHKQRIANLRALVERARKCGIGVYLYINEPRAMPTAFFEKHQELAGVQSSQLTALCTSQPVVRQWMGDALAYIFREVPGLSGVYAITASENLTNCASLGGWASCERCKTRTDAEIINEVVNVIEEGVHRSNPNAKVLISDWGWRGHGEASDMIARLPKSVFLMSVSEWNLPIERGGIKSTVGEYSISAVGPGPRSQRHWKAAHETGLKTGTEIQFNNTCEIASIPYLPVMDLVAEHFHNLIPAKIDAMLIGWTMGGYPSPNFQLIQKMSVQPAPDINSALDAEALERFGSDGAPQARKAWTLMSNAFREYPFHIGVVYTSPVQVGPANPLYLEKTGYRATMWGFPYDDLETWRGPYPPGVLAAQFEKVAEGWRAGIQELKLALEKIPPGCRKEAQSDLRLARAAGIHFQSVANQTRFIMARDALAAEADSLTNDKRTGLQNELKRLLKSEIASARELYTLVQEDSRIGFEPSCQYFYLPLDLVEKVVNCRWMLEKIK